MEYRKRVMLDTDKMINRKKEIVVEISVKSKRAGKKSRRSRGKKNSTMKCGRTECYHCNAHAGIGAAVLSIGYGQVAEGVA